MKQKFLLSVGAGLLCCACQQFVPENTPEPTKRNSFTLSEARAWYESQTDPGTRASDDDPDDAGCDWLRTGTLYPEWSRGLTSADERLDAVDVPAESRYFYRVVYDSTAYPIQHNLVVLQEADSNRVCCYTVFYIPDRSSVEAYTPEVCAYFCNRETKLLYNGLALFTLPSGIPVAADRYRDGIPVDGCFLLDTLESTFEQNREKLASMLDGLRLQRCTQNQTRGVNDNNPIDPVIIIGVYHPKLKMIPTRDDLKSPIVNDDSFILPTFKNDFDRLNGSVGGIGGVGNGNGDNGSDDDNTAGDKGGDNYSQNDKIKVKDQKVKEMLDSLLRDCMGKKAIESIDREVTIEYDGSRKGSTYDSGLITIGYSNSQLALLEELTHRYQMRNDLPGDRSHALNNEIEAKIGLVMYLDRYGENIFKYESIFGFSYGCVIFDSLNENYKPGIDYTDFWFSSYYNDAANILRSNKTYQDKQKYPLSSVWDLQALTELLSDC